jgi:hypothetical protein
MSGDNSRARPALRRPYRRRSLNFNVGLDAGNRERKMNTMKRWINYWNRKVKKFGILEVKMVQGAAIGATLIVVKLFPQILELSLWWFVALVVICALEVHYVLWLKKNGQGGPANGSRPLQSP